MPSADDVLSGLGPLLRVRPELDDLCRFGGSWTSSHAAEPPGWAYFHLVTRGQVQLDRPGLDRLYLTAGDILLLPHGDAHTLHSPDGGGHVSSVDPTQHRGPVRIRTSVGVELDTELICGRLHFEAAPQTLIIAAIPETVILHIDELPLASRFKPLVAGIREELTDGRAGAASIATDLASALFMMMLRTLIEASTTVTGLLQLLDQRVTAHAVLAMTRDPTRAWTLDELADVGATSRATLVRGFRKATGIAPMEFLADLRLGLARHRLANATASLDQVASDVGYRSTAAFSRAFLRKFGYRPGKQRQNSMV